MSKKITMPKLGFDMEEGSITQWFVKVGEQVNEGDIIAEVETAKATIEIESFESGKVTQILASIGDDIPVGSVIAVLDGDESGRQVVDAELNVETELVETQTTKVDFQNTNQVEPVLSDRKQMISPIAKRLIREFNLDSSKIIGTGPNGSVTKDDVLLFKDQGSPELEKKEDNISTLISKSRKLIGERMLLSTTTIPQFSVTVSIDMTNVVGIREKLDETNSGKKSTINDFVIKAAAVALSEYPALNSKIEGENILTFSERNIGVAVSLPKGLLTVTVREADKKTLGEISEEMQTLITRAKSDTLKPEDISGSTFTISNLGMFGIDSFTAIINPPEAAILSLGGIHSTPVFEENRWIPKQMMKATLVVDHRIGDGADAARLLNEIKQNLETFSN